MNRNILKLLLITVFITLIYSFVLIPLGVFTHLRLISRDLMIKCLYQFSDKPSKADDIVVVSIGRESLRHIGQEWPWTRDVFADLLLKLKEYGAKVIYLDFALIGKTDYDDALSSAMASAGNVVIPFYFDEKGEPLFPVQKFMESSAGFGPVNKLRDEDLVIRDALLAYFSKHGNIIDYSVELITVCKYFDVTIGNVSLENNKLVINRNGQGKLCIPIKRDGALPINYSVTLDDIEVIPFWKAIKGAVSPQVFKDKIVVIGLTDKALLDTYKTPLGMSSGVEIIVNTILTLISGDFIKYVSRDINSPILLFVLLLVSVTVFKFPTWKGLLVSILELVCYFCAILFLSWAGFLFDPFSVIFLGIIVYFVTKIYKFICLLEEQNFDLQKALKDLTEAEAELIEKEKLAVMGRLSAQLSHEINNPLCAIQNNVNAVKYIIEHGKKTDKIAGIIAMISNELVRLTKLSRDILSFSRPAREEVQPVNVNQIIKETIDVFRNQLENQKVNIILDLASRIPLTQMPPDRLKQVFSNLILNAKEAMAFGGELVIRTRAIDKQFVEISIRDTGYGIPKKILKKIFDPFFTTKGASKGTGLGLFTVYNIIKGYGGTVDVKSAEGKGTTFIVKLSVK